MNKRKIGIIAGNGNFPLITAQNAANEGYEVVTCAIKGEASDAVVAASAQAQWVKLGQLKKLADFFKGHDVSECIMAGKITKTNILRGDVIPDLEMIRVVTATKDRKDDTLLGAIADYLSSKGVTVIDSTKFLGDNLAQQGVLSKKKPSSAQKDDIQFGWDLAKEMGRLDIGQSVVVKNKSILAVEAIEGTDAAILRGGELGGRDATVVKVAKPNQDMRFDVPAVGLQTVESMLRAGAQVLAIESRKTILIDREALIKKIDQNKLVLIATGDGTI